jgi:hypothetical protein
VALLRIHFFMSQVMAIAFPPDYLVGGYSLAFDQISPRCHSSLHFSNCPIRKMSMKYTPLNVAED